MLLRLGFYRSVLSAVSVAGALLLAGCAGQNIGSTAPLTVVVSGPTTASPSTSYQQPLSVSGGTAPYSCSLTSGSLPAGLSLTNCVLTGTPTKVGTFTFTVTVLDASTPAHSGTVSITIVVTQPLTVGYNGATTMAATASYTASVTASGGTAPYSCSLSSGSLPAGLALNSNCSISGTPAVPGLAAFGVTVTDSSTPVRTGTTSVNLTVGPPPLQIITTALPGGAVGIQYSAAIATSGGITPVHCSYGSSMVPGLTLGTDCSISGTPTTPGNYSLNVATTDNSSPVQNASGTVTLQIAATPNTRVLAGTQPVIGASVQIYTAGTTGNASAPAALLTNPLTTNSLGGFTLPAASSYTCPTPTSVVYLLATGGKVGTGGATNANLVLMTSPGTCASLATIANLVINEPSTVASAYAFSQFMKKGGQVGATSTNLLGITLASATLANLVPPSTGAASLAGVPSPVTGTTSQAKINLLADIMNACLASSSPSSTTCSSFYSAATVGGVAPTTTLDAIMNLVQNPGINVAPLYALLPATPAYLPVPAAAPADWTLYVNYDGGGMSDPSAISIDSQGRVWVASYLGVASLFTNAGAAVFPYGIPGNSLNSSYGGAVDASDNFLISNEEGGPANIGTVTVLNNLGQPATGSPYTQGGLDFPIGVAVDTNGNDWYANYGNSSVTVLKADGTPVSGAAGYKSSQFVFPVAIAVDSNHNAWMTNQSSTTVSKISPDGTSITSYIVGGGPSGVAVDAQNNVWTANYYDDAIGLVSKTGTVASTYPGFKGGGVVHPQGIAVDGNGTVWVSNYRGPSLSELSGASTSSPGTALSPSAGWAPDSQLLEAFGLAIDASGNIWVTNFGNNTLTEFIGVAAPVKTPLVGVVAKP
jgi:hypothetical protein